MAKYLAVLEKGEHNYSAYVPEVDGLGATGRTAKQALRMLSEGLALHFGGQAAPRPRLHTREEAEAHLRAEGGGLSEGDELAWVELPEPDPVSAEAARAMREAGVPQAELARRMGTSQSAVSRLTSPGYGGHSVKALRRLAEALGLELEVKLVKRG